MASVGEMTVKLTVDTREFNKELAKTKRAVVRFGEAAERAFARENGTWNRFQMVAER